MKRTAGLAAVALVLVAGACGDAKSDDAVKRGGQPAPANEGDAGTAGGGPAGVPGASGGAPGSGGGAKPGTGGGAPGGPATGGAQGTQGGGEEAQATTIPLAVEFATACVRPGTTQTIVLRSDPNTDVGYDATYADGKTGWAPDHYGGSNKGLTGPTGEFRDTFAVKPGAPAGVVRVGAIAGNTRGYAQTFAEFKVSDATGKC